MKQYCSYKITITRLLRRINEKKAELDTFSSAAEGLTDWVSFLMKRKYLILSIVFLACLSMATVTQAAFHQNCLVIANGRSGGLTIPGGWYWDHPITHPRYIGGAGSITYRYCEGMTVRVIDKTGIHMYSDVSQIALSQTIGVFLWRCFPDYYFNLMAKSRIYAFAMLVNIS